jgi:hypothetical protein
MPFFEDRFNAIPVFDKEEAEHRRRLLADSFLVSVDLLESSRQSGTRMRSAIL